MEKNIDLVEKALKFAAVKHRHQIRKEADLPYITHLVSVAFILKKYNFSDDIVAAGLLHDTLEDTKTTEEELHNEFGENILSIIKGCTEDKSLDYDERKSDYIQKKKIADEQIKAVSTADKIHNLKSVLENHAKIGDEVWKIFNRGKVSKINFDNKMLEAVSTNWDHPIVEEYRILVNKLNTL